MWVRKRLDIRWSDLGCALRDCVTRWDRKTLSEEVEELWTRDNTAFASLSVRSGFDLWLEALALPAGSEVLVSAITIRDMVRIIEAHGLVPVPVDLNPEDLSIDIESMQRAISPKTRAVLVAHLFGTRQPLEPILKIAKEHGLFVAEDCAQAFAGRQFTGHAEADVSMFSFGSIKTATALGGAILTVRDAALRRRMKELQTKYPIQTRGHFIKRVFKHGLMKLMSYGPQFASLVFAMRMLGRDPDKFIAGTARGFPGSQLLLQLRRQPCAALLAIMHRRVAFYSRRSLEARMKKGERLLSLIGSVAPSPGSHSAIHSYWVVPVLHDEPTILIRRLFDAGFDASLAHSLFVVPPPADQAHLRAETCEEMLPQIVHLPAYPEIPDRELRRLAQAVRASVVRAPVDTSEHTTARRAKTRV
jgi:perosamine synthetase